MNDSRSPQEQIEATALRRSAIGYLFMALLGGLFFYLASSEAILLDGVYSFVSLLMTFVAQQVSRLVNTPYSDDFHFGYAHFEPLLNVVRILLILAIAGFAAASAIVALIDGGRPLNADSAVIYGLVAASGCLFMAWLQRRAARRASSPILSVDARNWLVDGVLSSGVALTFMVALLLRGSEYAHWIPYVDPLLVIVMVTLLVPVPLRSLKSNLNEVLLAAPDPETQHDIRARVESVLEAVENRDIAIRAVPVGRFLFLRVSVLVPPGTEVGVIDECDAIRLRLYEALRETHPRLVLDMDFTADQRWIGMDKMPL